MKTLDGVIKSLEEMIDLTDADSESEGYYLAMDSIEYLKEYREMLDNVEPNEPLEWNTLHAYVGKPVWVSRVGKNRWAIVAGFYMDAFGIEKVCIWMPHDYWNLKKEEVESIVKVYRKEKK